MVKCFGSMAVAFERGWSVVKARPRRDSDGPFAPAPPHVRAEAARIEAKVMNNEPLDSDERISRVPHGHNWQSFGYRWGKGMEVPECQFCGNTVYHAPIKTTYAADDTVFCNDFDCIDKAHELIGSRGYEGAHEITSDHDKGFTHPVGDDQYETGHVGHQEWDSAWI